MALRINTNAMSLTAHRNLGINDRMLGKSLEKLSSGFRINRAGDDAAGLVKSESLRSEVRGLNQAVKNAEDGISFVQTAEGALNEIHSMLQRMSELAVSAANTATSDGTAEQAELAQLNEQINQIGASTQFAGITVFDANPLTFHIGGNAGENIAITVGAMSAADLGVDAVDLTTASGDANAAITTIRTAIDTLSATRGSLGATQNRLEHTITNLQVAGENLTASESRIRDADIAKEMVDFTRNQIMVQAGTSMLAQANQVPQSVLQLIR
ncbi:MAG: flagellin [Actinomycetota bacterium]|nr:flagellin [Actinomycetota bacterium]